MRSNTRTRWEGSRGYAPAVALANAIVNSSSAVTPEEELTGRLMRSLLSSARPVVCPPAQLAAISDDVFEDLGQAFEYAMVSRLPFEITFFDFLDEYGRGPDMGLHLVEGGGRDLGLELRGVVAAELVDEQQTTFIPIAGMRNGPPEELGMAFVHWDSSAPAFLEPRRWRESMPLAGSGEREVTLMSVSAAMQAINEQPRAVQGALLGCIRAGQGGQSPADLQAVLATSTATATRMALKLLYLLDSVNVDVDRIPVSRQVRRQAERSGGEIAWTVKVSAPQRDARVDEKPGQRDYSHRFEVRGNFAHHRAGSWLFEHSAPEDIRPCPRCGRCRRVWRPPHVKGPPDRPLAIKIRHVEFGDGV